MGATYDQIGKALEVSEGAAHRYVKQALESIATETRETAEEVRTLELERIDEMLRIIAPDMQRGDYKAMQMNLRLMERRARLLGLDAPSKHEHGHRIDVEHGISRGEIDDLEKMWRQTVDGDAVEIPPEEEFALGEGTSNSEGEG